ncbi:MAG: P-II family nitrogen regulator [Coriobacteriales bacterium]|jgi:nitrogen regulatory protein P-II 1
MIKIEAIVREERLEDVKSALQAIEVRGITVSQVMGCGTTMGYVQQVRGRKVNVNLLPKVKFEIVVSTEEWANKTIKAIEEAARTGQPGDGKIFCYPIDRAVRIRTGEEGVEAIQPRTPVIEGEEG